MGAFARKDMIIATRPSEPCARHGGIEHTLRENKNYVLVGRHLTGLSSSSSDENQRKKHSSRKNALPRQRFSGACHVLPNHGDTAKNHTSSKERASSRSPGSSRPVLGRIFGRDHPALAGSAIATAAAAHRPQNLGAVGGLAFEGRCCCPLVSVGFGGSHCVSLSGFERVKRKEASRLDWSVEDTR